MQFLAPLFLFAMAALAVPIALHIRRRRPRERVAFSAVQFLDESVPVQRRHLRLQDLLLLLLRCLAIALVVLAFTRPFFGNDSATAYAGGRSVVILVDTSASMRGERLAEAKRRAEAILADVAPEDRVAVATFDETFHPVLSPRAGAADATRAAIRSIEAGWRSTNLAAALEGSTDIVEEDRETSGSEDAVIHVVSDLQQTAIVDGLDGFSWPPRVRVAPVQIGGENWTNAGVQITVSEENRGVRVSNSAGSETADFQLEWPDGPATVLRVESGTTSALPIRVNADRVALRGDSFEFDNRAWIAPAVDFSVGVDYIGTDSDDDASGALFFLSRAFSASKNPSIDLRTQPSSDSRSPALTIIDQPLSAEAAAGIREAIEAGGHALLVLRDTGMQSTVEALTGEEIALEEVEPSRSALFGRIDFDDPVFAPFSDPRYSNFSPIATWKYRRLSVPDHAEVLAAFSSGDPALLRIPAGKGTLFVLTTSWRPMDSQLALSSKFAPLLLAMLAESEDFHPPTVQVHIGDPVRLPRGAAAGIRTPDGRTAEAVDGIFRETAEPGLYRIADESFVFAVNPPPQETDLTPIPATTLRALGIPLELREPSSGPSENRPAAIRTDLENHQKWWRWLILAAIVALVTETAVAAWSSRNQPVHS